MLFRFLLPIILHLSVVVSFGQKSTSPSKTSIQLEPEGKLEGVVSHKFKKQGCGILVTVKVGGKKIFFMPKTPLTKDLEKNGLHIKFNYRRLRIPSPPNCEFCYMVELRDIEKK